MMTLVVVAAVILSQSVFASSWGIGLKKEGNGSGKICFISSDKIKNCRADEADQDLNFVVNNTALILADPSTDSVFSGWRGDCSGHDRICQLKVVKTLDGRPLEAIATFLRIKHKARPHPRARSK